MLLTLARARRHVLQIDCHQLCKNSRSEAKLVSVRPALPSRTAPPPLTRLVSQELADSVGYFPQFVLGSSINNMIDLAAMGLIGQKAGFSASLDAQLKAVRLAPLSRFAPRALTPLNRDDTDPGSDLLRPRQNLDASASESGCCGQECRGEEGERGE